MSSLNIYLIFVDNVQDQMVRMFVIEINCVINSRNSKLYCANRLSLRCSSRCF